MLMAISLAEKLGARNLLSFSLHPGVIITNLANHLIEDFEASFGELGMCFALPYRILGVRAD
jgi:hypothetical protein